MKLKRILTPFLILMILFASVGGTVAFLIDATTPVVNTFNPTNIAIETYENFDGTNKKDIYVQNDGTANAYVRVKLIGYWYDNQDDTIIAKQSWFDMSANQPNNKWVYLDGYYYYTEVVEANGGKTEHLFDTPIVLGTNSEDGARKVLEIVAESIQVDGKNGTGQSPVELAWGSEAAALVK